MDIKENLEKIRKEIPMRVELVAVSKFHPVEMVKQAYEGGQRRFGESRVQEFLVKFEKLPKDIEWHFIGHLQTNKAKQIIGLTSLIESVDSEKLLNLINSESSKKGLTTKILLQVHVAQEESKFGFYPEELLDYIKSGKFKLLKNIEICGVMGMASNTDDPAVVRNDFKKIFQTFERIKELAPELKSFSKISMGMSGDWKIAVEEGSNIVRIGSAIFGDRI